MAVAGNLEYRVANAFVTALKADTATKALVGTAIRISYTTSGTRARPCIAVSALADQTVPRTNEYHMRVQIQCETQAAVDTDGTTLTSIVGAVRDWLHKDRTSGGFAGDCEGALQELNAQAGIGVVFHQIHEGATFDDSGDNTLRQIVDVDAWCYPGSTS